MRQAIFTLICASVFVFFACDYPIVDPENGSVNNGNELSAAFTVQISSDCPQLPCTVSVSNESENATDFSWDFGDGTELQRVSTTTGVNHNYLSHGTFTIRLVAENGSKQDIAEEEIEINPTTFTAFLNSTTSDLRPSAMIANSDNDFIVVGSFGGDAFMSKIDETGKEEWFRAYGGSGTQSANAVVERDGGGYMLAGWSSNAGGDFYMIKTDAGGNLTNSWTFGGSDIETAFDITKTGDGNFALVGEACCNYASSASYDYLFMKISDNGVKLAESSYGYSGNEYPKAIFHTSDGGFIMTGTSWRSFPSSGTANEFYVVKTNNNGGAQWDKNYGTPDETDYGTDIIETSSGNFLMTGASTDPSFSGAMIIEMNSSGQQLNKTSFGGQTAVGNSLIEAADGGFLVLGTREENGSKQVYLYKTDKDLNFLWDRSFGGNGDDLGYAIQAANDGGFIILGSTKSFSGKQEIYLIKVNSEGNVL